jgi:hypothetical protein
MEDLGLQMGESLGFRSVRNGSFMAKDGPARTPDAAYCNKKICFAATDIQFLAELLHELSEHPKAYFVKFSTKPRDGMFLGRCFFIDKESVGVTWAKYKGHPKVFCNIQDDDFSIGWREEVRDWSKADDDEDPDGPEQTQATRP